MKRRVVFDVNTLVSAFVAPCGAPARSVRAALVNEWDIAHSSHIIDTLREVLDRPKFQRRFAIDDLDGYVEKFRSLSTVVVPDSSVRGVAPDEEDDLVLGTAVAARADFLVTGDKGLLAIGEYRGVSIVTTREFLAVMDRLEP